MTAAASTRLILASASPRRLELLRQIGVEPEVRPVDIDETPEPGEAAGHYVRRLALAKARAARNDDDPRPVLGSDTAVVLDGDILGKPADRAEAESMLRRLAGRSHTVMTAVAVITAEREMLEVVHSDVEFAPLSAAEITAYWETGEPVDKAGAYGIQGLAAAFVRSVSGSYSGVVGLPLHETVGLLRAAGLTIAGRSGSEQ